MINHQSNEASPDAEDLRDETAVFTHVVLAHPQVLRSSDLIRELGNPEDFVACERTERAVRGLLKVGLLFQRDGMVLPTPAALRAYEVFSS